MTSRTAVTLETTVGHEHEVCGGRPGRWTWKDSGALCAKLAVLIFLCGHAGEGHDQRSIPGRLI